MVSDMSASVTIDVRRTYDSDLAPSSLTYKKWWYLATMNLLCTNIHYQYPVELYAGSYQHYNTVLHIGDKSFDDHEYILSLSWLDRDKSSIRAIGIHNPTVSDLYEYVNALKISVEFLPYVAEIRSGTADFVINGIIHKQFDIIGNTNPPISADRVPTHFITVIAAAESTITNSTPDPRQFWAPHRISK